MKLIEKLAKTYCSCPNCHDGSASDPYECKRDDFEAGFRKAREMILNSPEWDHTNWIEVRKDDLRKFGEEEVE